MQIWENAQKILQHPLMRFGENTVTLATIFDFILVLVIALVAAALVKWFLLRRVFKLTRFDQGLQYVLSRIFGYLVFIFGFLIGLDFLGIDLTSFTVLAGAFGVGIGFGLQNIVNNFVSGVIILSERMVQLGDKIEVGGVTGFIQRIGARSTSLLTTDNLMVIVPNSELISKSVTRWGRDSRFPIRIDVQVGVAYGSDLREVRNLLMEIAAQNPHVIKDPAPFAGIVEFGDSWITFKLFVSTVSMINKEMALRTELYISIEEEFKKRGISIPFTQYDLLIKEPLRVEMMSFEK